jgi:hypothetical protein
MVEEKAGASPQSATATDWHPKGAAPKDPGWYPMGTSPNDQSYWDGTSWTGRRHWTVNGWVEQGSPAPGRRMSANPYAPPATAHAHAQAQSSPTSLNVGVLLLLVSGIALMLGSIGSWIRVSGSVGILAFHASLNGIDPGIAQLIGVNGYVTFVGGIVLLVFGGLALANDEQYLAVLTFVVAGATLVFAIYDMFRIVQKISNVHTSAHSNISIGAGLICVLSAAVLAVIVTLVRLASR